MDGVFTHVSGRQLLLTELRQSLVYSGLLEGLPTREMNEKYIKRLLSQERKKGAVHLLPPKQTAISYDGEYPFGDPASLPRVECVGYFNSTGQNPCYRSYLTIVWFQNDYAFPVAPEEQTRLLAIDWNGLSTENEL